MENSFFKKLWGFFHKKLPSFSPPAHLIGRKPMQTLNKPAKFEMAKSRSLINCRTYLFKLPGSTHKVMYAPHCRLISFLWRVILAPWKVDAQGWISSTDFSQYDPCLLIIFQDKAVFFHEEIYFPILNIDVDVSLEYLRTLLYIYLYNCLLVKGGLDKLGHQSTIYRTNFGRLFFMFFVHDEVIISDKFK